MSKNNKLALLGDDRLQLLLASACLIPHQSSCVNSSSKKSCWPTNEGNCLPPTQPRGSFWRCGLSSYFSYLLSLCLCSDENNSKPSSVVHLRMRARLPFRVTKTSVHLKREIERESGAPCRHACISREHHRYQYY